MAFNLSSLSSNFSSSLSTARSSLTSVNSGLSSAVNNLNSNISDIGNIGADLGNIANTIDSAIAGPASKINNFTSSITGEIDNVVNNFSNQLLTSNKQIVNALGQVQNVFNETAKITDNIDNLTDTIGNSLTKGLPNISGQVTQFSSQALNAVNNITGVTNTVSSTVGGAIGDINQRLINTNIPIFQQAAGNLTSGFNNIQNSLNQRITGITSRVNNVVNTVDSVSNLLSNPQQLTTELNNTLDNLVQTGLNDLLAPIQNIFNSVNNFAENLSVIPDNLNNLVGDSIGRLNNYVESATQVFQDNQNTTSNDEVIPTGIRSTGADGSSKLKNVLRDYNTYNYIITLGVLDNEEQQNPRLYRDRGSFKYNLLKSGGGEYEHKVTIAEEDPDIIEYFIEDLEIDSVVAPNPNTGLTIGTTVSFTVLEPYSMGKFLETIVAGAGQAGYKNHIAAPYCLRIEFIGWDEYGSAIRNDYAIPRYIPIKITNIQFDVTGAGSKYTVEGVVYSDLATEDRINKLPSEAGPAGKSPLEMLLTSDQSITNVINATIEKAEDNNTIGNTFDRFLICFPPEHDSIHKAIQTRQGGGTPFLTEAVAGGQNQGLNRPINASSASLEAFGGLGRLTGGMYDFLRSWAFVNVNEIGNSLFVEDITDGSNYNNNRPLGVWDSDSNTYNRIMEPNKTTQARSVQFPTGAAITGVIEETVKNCKVIREATEEDNGDGRKLYFRIETYVFDDYNPSAEIEYGRHPRVYVYAVHPYYYDEAKITGVAESPNALSTLKQQAAKEYNYYHTGKNEDIINFNITFNYAYFNRVKGDFGQGKVDLSNSVAKTNKSPNTKSAEVRTTEIGENGNPMLGLQPEWDFIHRYGNRRDLTKASKMELTDFVHNNLLNSPVDLIQAEVSIWGDPYYIPTDFGNYAAPQRAKLINNELGMPWIREEILCVMNFRTPLDYPVNGFVIDFPELSRPFTGVYQVWAVTNKFNEGKFTQELKMLRRDKQDVPGTPNNSQGKSEQGSGVAADGNVINPNMSVFQTRDTTLLHNSLIGDSTNGTNQVDLGLIQGVLDQGNMVNLPNGTTFLPATNGTVTTIVSGTRPPTSRPLTGPGSQSGPF